MLKLTLPMIVSLIFLLTSTSQSQDSISAKYFPLNTGNKWIYRIQNNIPPFNESKVYKIVKDSIFNNHKYFLLESSNSSEWMRYDSLTGNLLFYNASAGCSIYSNDKIFDSLASSIGNVINCQFNGIFSRECILISTETIFNTFQKQVKEFEHDGLVLQYIRYAEDFGIIYLASGEPPPVSYFEILKGCIINGIVYGDTTLTSIKQTSNIIPEKFSLNQNYPNPFNPGTILKYSIPNTQYTILKVIDALGKEITTLVNEKQNAGIYSVEFDGSNLSSGIYFYRLEAGDFVETKRMLLLK